MFLYKTRSEQVAIWFILGTSVSYLISALALGAERENLLIELKFQAEFVIEGTK